MNQTFELEGVAGWPLEPLQVPQDENRPCVPVTFTLVKGSGEFLYEDDRTDTLGGAVAEFQPDKPGRFRIECTLGEHGQLGLIVFKGTVKGRRKDDPEKYGGQKKPKRRRRSPTKKPKDTPPAEPPKAAVTEQAPATADDIPVTVEEPRPAAAPDPTFLEDGAPCPPLTPPVWPVGPTSDPLMAPPPQQPSQQQRPRAAAPKTDIKVIGARRGPNPYLTWFLLMALLILFIVCGIMATHKTAGSAAVDPPSGPATSIDCTRPTGVRFLAGHRMVLEGCIRQ